MVHRINEIQRGEGLVGDLLKQFIPLKSAGTKIGKKLIDSTNKKIQDDILSLSQKQYGTGLKKIK